MSTYILFFDNFVKENFKKINELAKFNSILIYKTIETRVGLL